jgi:transcriptional/translational regulatory protein YebC/TACO1
MSKVSIITLGCKQNKYESDCMARILEENGFEVVGAEFTYIPNDLKEVTAEQRESIDKMVERLEEFDDVQTVYTNMKPADAE